MFVIVQNNKIKITGCTLLFCAAKPRSVVEMPVSFCEIRPTLHHFFIRQQISYLYLPPLKPEISRQYCENITHFPTTSNAHVFCCALVQADVIFNLIFVVPCIMLYSGEISPTRCNNCVFILRNGFILHVSGDNLTHHQEYICCIWPQVSRLT